MGVEQSLLALLGAADVGGYEIDQSLRFDGTAYLNRTPASAGNRRTFTFSAWVKRANLGATCFLMTQGPNPGSWDAIRFDSNDRLAVRINNDTNVVDTARLFRDPSAWYHIVIAVDTTQATAANRVKIYINNQQDSINNTGYPSQNQDLSFNNNIVARIGIPTWNTSESLRGYLAEVNFIDGSALTPSDFGEEDDNGVWRPIRYAGSYTGNSFYLKFASGDGTDSSGLSNTWTANNFTTSGTGTDVMSDTPTTNWCTLNPLIISNTTTAPSLSNGNLFGTFGSNDQYPECGATFSPMGLKGYFELSDADSSGGGGSGQDFLVGFIKTTTNPSKSNYTSSNAFYYDLDNARIRQGGTTLISSYTSQSVADDIIGVAFDFTGSNRNVWFSLNGTWGNNGSGVGNPATGANPGLTASDLGTTDEYRFYFGFGLGPQVTFNFGQRAFAQTVPTGYSALNTSNLPAPDIADGSKYFDTLTYTGDGLTPKEINGLAFQPDFVWIKNMNASNSHVLTDAVRGATKSLATNSPDQESTSTNKLKTFDSDGFTVGNDTTVNLSSGRTYVAWSWLGGNGTTTPSGGSIASTVSANPAAGFSIVSYTGNGTGGTVAHGLGVPPKMMIIKDREAQTRWIGYFEDLGNAKYLRVDDLAVAASDTTVFNSTSPTDSVFTVGSSANTNSTNDFIAYCFAEVEGYSKVGKYRGNSSNDGAFVYTGFKPAFVLVKGDLGQDWFISDSVRDPYNLNTRWLRPNLPDLEVNDPSTGGSSHALLSNGFKWYTNTFGVNRDYDYYYIAFAQHPFGGSGVSPATAR